MKSEQKNDFFFSRIRARRYFRKVIFKERIVPRVDIHIHEIIQP